MKIIKYLVFGTIIFFVIVVVFAFFFLQGAKAKMDWYETPRPMSTQLADSIFKRSKEKFVNAYKRAKVVGNNPGKAIFSFAADLRTVEAFCELYYSEDMEKNGYLRPQLAKVDDKLRLSTMMTKGALKGAVMYFDVELSVTKDGKLKISPGTIMVGKRKMPGFVLSELEKHWGGKWGPVEVAPEDIVFDDPDKRDLVINAKLLKVEVVHNYKIDELVFTMKRLK